MIRIISGINLVLMFIISIAIITSATDVCGQESEKKYTEKEYQQALNQLDPRPLDPAIDPDSVGYAYIDANTESFFRIS